MFTHHSLRHLAACLTVILLIAACDREPAAPPEQYSVRAMVRQLPDADDRRPEILVRHEAIPSFKNEDGEVVGMDVMSMPFPLTDIALVADVEVGDRIAMDFEVSWQGGNPLKVTAIEKLPAETRLAFESEGDASDAP